MATTVTRFPVRISLRAESIPTGTSYCAELSYEGHTRNFSGLVPETDVQLVLARACVLLVRTLKAPSELHFSINDAAVCAIGNAIPVLYGNNWRDAAGNEPANLAVWQELCRAAQEGQHKLRSFSCTAAPGYQAKSEGGARYASKAARRAEYEAKRLAKYLPADKLAKLQAEFGELSNVELGYAGFPYGAALIRAHRELTGK